jgi:hypothetical protein
LWIAVLLAATAFGAIVRAGVAAIRTEARLVEGMLAARG